MKCPMDSPRRLITFLAIFLLTTTLKAQQPAFFAEPHGLGALWSSLLSRIYADRSLDKDVELMQKAGITVVRVGESTWSTWEPRDGDFQFAWMQRVLDRMQQAGIKVILGTPTHSIPTWLYKEHPEILVTHGEASAPPLSDSYMPSYAGASPPGAYGVRQNYDFLNPEFRRHAERVIREIVGHFKDHPAVIGFQIDNETFPTGILTKYTQAAFLERLKQKFNTPEAMNPGLLGTAGQCLWRNLLRGAGARSELAVEEIADRGRDLHCVCFERKMAGVVEMQLRSRVVALKSLGSRR